MEQWTSFQHRDDVARAVAAAGIPSAPVRALPEVATDPHLFERGIVREVEHPTRGRVKVIGNPIKLGAHAESELTAAPGIGQHTDEVLRSLLGVEPSEVEALRRAGTI